jgi:hypothetical protein
MELEERFPVSEIMEKAPTALGGNWIGRRAGRHQPFTLGASHVPKVNLETSYLGLGKLLSL